MDSFLTDPNISSELLEVLSDDDESEDSSFVEEPPIHTHNNIGTIVPLPLGGNQAVGQPEFLMGCDVDLVLDLLA